MTLVCKSHGIGDSLIKPIHGGSVIIYLTLFMRAINPKCG